ncbi:hypothetical protein THAOC_27606, partial [Thalassiosira oceanica]
LKEGKRLKCFVAKDSLHQTEETKEAFHHTFCLVQSRALEWADRYNQAIKMSPLLKPADECLKAPQLRFLCPSVYSIKQKGRNGERKDYLVEVKLEGKFHKFHKWNSNNGFVSKSKVVDAGQTIELKAGSELVPLEQFVHAFTHWVYEASQREIIVCDLQGVLNRKFACNCHLANKILKRQSISLARGGQTPRVHPDRPCHLQSSTSESIRENGHGPQRYPSLGLVPQVRCGLQRSQSTLPWQSLLGKDRTAKSEW